MLADDNKDTEPERKIRVLPLLYKLKVKIQVFIAGSDGKESACNVGDLGLIQGWEDPQEVGMATHSNILTWRIPWTEATVHGVAKRWTLQSY